MAASCWMSVLSRGTSVSIEAFSGKPGGLRLAGPGAARGASPFREAVQSASTQISEGVLPAFELARASVPARPDSR